MSRLSLIDACFTLFETPTTPMHVGGLLILKSQRQHFANELFDTLLQHQDFCSPFDQLIKQSPASWPRWQRARQVRIENHIHLHSIGDNHDVHALVSQLHSGQLDRRKPLWEVHIIDDAPRQRVGLYIKIHHAYADGVKLSHMLNTMLGTEANAERVPAFWENNFKSRGGGRAPVKQVIDFANALYHQIQELPNLAKLTGKLLSRTLYPSISKLPIPFTAEKTLFNQRPKQSRVIAQGTLPIKSIKRIGQYTGASVNEVVLTVCDAALHQYLIDHKRPSNKPLVAIMPVNMKQDATEKDNLFSPALIELGRRNHQPTERLKEVMISSRQIKHEAKTFSPTAFMNLSIATNALVMLIGFFKLDKHLPTACNLVISNVPGPKDQRYFMDAEIESITPYSVLLPDQALNITLFSYQDQLHVGVTACDDALADADLLVPYITKALTALELDLLSVTLQKVEQQLEQGSLTTH
ncbi:wax ester/triacylglycerol synthase family O-acyltransferase [Ferrimonas aestuarii]|uniref:diacylglycerol O-acyltransferase n=1 Tax=Ferrimonas aestuarii TaxID=2569539 RepID=A0A4U1BSX8_9GAMM|nr:wax ester/triacylglycerol synthase family O-acyltransferase [Ferrimonas aestuarii]TKB58272.1 wax ester/triacylglycerol synthase family O-acyltransferase [Ferrimonas aestuarii]